MWGCSSLLEGNALVIIDLKLPMRRRIPPPTPVPPIAICSSIDQIDPPS